MRLEIDMALPTGNVQETVTVTGQSPLLQTTSSSTGQVVETRGGRVCHLRIAICFRCDHRSRRSRLRRGGTPATSGSVGFGDWSATGGPTNTNEFMLDGATAIIGNMNAASIIPTQDAIQEFKVNQRHAC